MAETNCCLHAALDPRSLIHSQFSDSDRPQHLQLDTHCFALERGPRFKEYADLRDRKLRMKYLKEKSLSPENKVDEKAAKSRTVLTPPKKLVKFNSNLVTPPKRSSRHSVLAQSVPDFSTALRKENRKPAAMPPVADRSATPPAKGGRRYGKAEVGSKSANSGDKRWGWAGRKSYGAVAELKGLGVAAGNAIKGPAGRSGISKTVLGNRLF